MTFVGNRALKDIVICDATTGLPVGIGQLGTPTDTARAAGKITTNATPGVWAELLAASASRNGAELQNKGAASVSFVQSATQPSNGAQAGEIEVPATPAYYKFDYAPRGRYWLRSATASIDVTIVTW